MISAVSKPIAQIVVDLKLAKELELALEPMLCSNGEFGQPIVSKDKRAFRASVK